MRKRRLKKGIRNILYFIIFAVLFSVSFEVFDVWSIIEEKFFVSDSGVRFGKLYVHDYDVKVVDLKSKSRPVAVSINNNHAAWPHSGLQDAYLAYELIAEGGITRILAFYKDKDTSKIGSVRSARHYFLDYILENDAIFVHYGQSPQAKSDLKELGINNLNGLSDYSVFYRDNPLNKAYEHTAFTTMKKINKGIKDKGYSSVTESSLLLKYSPLKVNYGDGISAKNIMIEYSDYQNTSYEYDEENYNYKMFMDGKAHVDAESGEQYIVKNIITYQVENTTLDTKGRQNLKNIGSGEGYYISNGEAIKIKWSKESRNSKTIYTYGDNKELVVNDGNTWIHIQPLNKKLVIE